MTRLGTVLAVLLAAGVAAAPPDVSGCAGAFRPGDRVDVADETALVVWDAGSKTEHFVRRATFVGTAYDFGFLVPTPAEPKVEAADPGLFDSLQDLTAPKVLTRHEVGLNLGCGGLAPRTAREAAAPGGAGAVVLEQKRVGDLDAAVLGFEKGRDPDDAAGGVLKWLLANGYTARPALTAWLRPYAAAGWVVTAFKLAGPPPEGPRADPARGATGRDAGGPPRGLGAQSAAVRMSFKVEAGRPFFPYREPADQRDGRAAAVPRTLRVYVVSDGRVAGKLGDGAAAWPGKTVWAGPVADPDRAALARAGDLPGDGPPAERWLTEFEDASAPRPGTDEVYFEPSADPSPVARPPVHRVVTHTPWWLGAAAVAGGLVLLWAAAAVVRRVAR
ncbi:MAG: hypothetical protein C0501_13415 [Isosphaera sp.]|nr:hypothetical protein [Isosphaera sp.]